MRQLGLVIICLVALCIYGCSQGSQEAAAHTINNITNIEASDSHTVAGLKVDAPNLVKLTENTTLGLEGGKNVLKDIFHTGTRDYFEADKGYFAYVKVTYSGCLLNCKGE